MKSRKPCCLLDCKIIQNTSDSVVIRDRRALENMIESKSPIEPCGAFGAAESKAILHRKSLLRDSKEIANASDFAEPLTLSALSLHETRRKIVAS